MHHRCAHTHTRVRRTVTRARGEKIANKQKGISIRGAFRLIIIHTGSEKGSCGLGVSPCIPLNSGAYSQAGASKDGEVES